MISISNIYLFLGSCVSKPNWLCNAPSYVWTPQDEQEQLAMCIFPPGVPPPVYVSVWLALDDCDAANGCLEVRGYRDFLVGIRREVQRLTSFGPNWSLSSPLTQSETAIPLTFRYATLRLRWEIESARLTSWSNLDLERLITVLYVALKT